MDSTWAFSIAGVFAMNLQDREELWALAGEYVLGVLTAEEVAEVERLMASNDELRAAIHYWENRLWV